LPSDRVAFVEDVGPELSFNEMPTSAQLEL